MIIIRGTLPFTSIKIRFKAVIVSINQPAYLPWPGYFDRIHASDRHVILDHVQFEKNSLINRNKILTPHGEQWLTIPISTKGKFKELPINELVVANQKSGHWQKKHLRAIYLNYSKTRNFKLLYPMLEQTLLNFKSDKFLDIVAPLNSIFSKLLGCNTIISNSSQMSVRASKSDLILGICNAIGATSYLSGPMGRHYLDEKKFEKEGIAVKYHDYVMPSYEQHLPCAMPNLSVLDLLMNCELSSVESKMIEGRHLS